MVNISEVVFVHCSFGSDDALNPSRKLIGATQPRGLRAIIPGMSGDIFADILACIVEIWLGIAVPDIAIVVVVVGESSKNPPPSLRNASGRHCTLPFPLANKLSTHKGNAPVVLYRAKMTSERSCVQSFSMRLAACFSASRRAALSASFFARLSNGRARDAAGRISSGPRMASL